MRLRTALSALCFIFITAAAYSQDMAAVRELSSEAKALEQVYQQLNTRLRPYIKKGDGSLASARNDILWSSLEAVGSGPKGLAQVFDSMLQGESSPSVVKAVVGATIFMVDISLTGGELVAANLTPGVPVPAEEIEAIKSFFSQARKFFEKTAAVFKVVAQE